jgi:hypothetical protein
MLNCRHQQLLDQYKEKLKKNDFSRALPPSVSRGRTKDSTVRDFEDFLTVENAKCIRNRKGKQKEA